MTERTGHAPEHVASSLAEKDHSGALGVVLPGQSLSVNSAGRPDLLGKTSVPILPALLTATLIWPIGTMACPLCNSPTGQQVRAGIFDDGFWGTLAAVISPFPVLLLCLAVYHYGIPKPLRRKKV